MKVISLSVLALTVAVAPVARADDTDQTLPGYSPPHVVPYQGGVITVLRASGGPPKQAAHPGWSRGGRKRVRAVGAVCARDVRRADGVSRGQCLAQGLAVRVKTDSVPGDVGIALSLEELANRAP